MVVLSVPLVVPNFVGHIDRVCFIGRETLAFIKLTAWEKEWQKISAKIQELSPSLEKVTALRQVQTGNSINFHLIYMLFLRIYIVRKKK